MQRIILILLSLFPLVTVAQKIKTTTTKANMEILKKLCHKWHPTHIEAGGQRQPMEQGEDGSYMWFKENGSIEQAGDGQKQTGKWVYDTNKKIVRVTNDKISINYTIEKLTATELVIHTKNDVIGEFSFVLRKVK